MLTRNLSSFSFAPAGFRSRSCLEISYRNFPSATILQTGGFAVGAISTRSRPMLWALRKASDNFMMPSCSPVDPKITRTSRARIRPFTRNCCCRLNQAPGRQSGSAPQRRVFPLSQFFDFHQCELVDTLWRRRGCDDRDDVLALKIARRKEVVGNIFALARRRSEEHT